MVNGARYVGEMTISKSLKQTATSAIIGASITASLFCVNQMATAHADPFTTCPNAAGIGTVDDTPTSCAFAANVRVAWKSQPGEEIWAYSPVTGKTYLMSCTPTTVEVDGFVRIGRECYGGNGAGVVIW